MVCLWQTPHVYIQQVVLDRLLMYIWWCVFGRLLMCDLYVFIDVFDRLLVYILWLYSTDSSVATAPPP
ncbi:MAG: hypothetical protein LUD00_04705, partial [Prevotellaceae bacterium]|nr:hypothetical protein [Prevotellaceae bacterium]